MTVSFQEGATLNPHLADLVIAIDQDLRQGCEPAPKVAKSVENLFATLDPSVLCEGLEAKVVEQGYSQSCVHLDPAGRFSIILLVWKNGQFTPVHNHRTWGVVSVLEGIEKETQYSADGPSNEVELRESGETPFKAGDVSWFNPPDDIHRVENGGTGLAMSLHVYGCDYREKPTSILRDFGDAIDMV